jgi:hypothetical protein
MEAPVSPEAPEEATEEVSSGNDAEDASVQTRSILKRVGTVRFPEAVRSTAAKLRTMMSQVSPMATFKSMTAATAKVEQMPTADLGFKSEVTVKSKDESTVSWLGEQSSHSSAKISDTAWSEVSAYGWSCIQATKLWHFNCYYE